MTGPIICAGLFPLPHGGLPYPPAPCCAGAGSGWSSEDDAVEQRTWMSLQLLPESLTAQPGGSWEEG